MDSALETRKRWSAVGKFVFWVVAYFWAVWLFDQLLPEVPEQTPAEIYIQKRMGGRPDDGASDSRRSDGGNSEDQKAGEASDN